MDYLLVSITGYAGRCGKHSQLLWFCIHKALCSHSIESVVCSCILILPGLQSFYITCGSLFFVFWLPLQFFLQNLFSPLFTHLPLFSPLKHTHTHTSTRKNALTHSIIPLSLLLLQPPAVPFMWALFSLLPHTLSLFLSLSHTQTHLS